jgi:hypothetical protein
MQLIKMLSAFLVLWISSSFNDNGACAQQNVADTGIPKLIRRNGVSQLYVDNKPFLILGGELNNSSSSSLNYLSPIWKQITALHFNTLLTPLSWELVEPKEGEFNFALVDSLIRAARQNDKHLVFLWLASWKNGMSSYAPLWVRENYDNYPLCLKITVLLTLRHLLR